MLSHSTRYIALTAALLAAGFTASAEVPIVDRIGVRGGISCGVPPGGSTAMTMRHYDKIIFVINSQFTLPAANPADQAKLDAIPRNVELDIKVTDNPRTIADLKGKVLSFIGAMDNSDTRPAITIKDVDYAVVCTY